MCMSNKKTKLLIPVFIFVNLRLLFDAPCI